MAASLLGIHGHWPILRKYNKFSREVLKAIKKIEFLGFKLFTLISILVYCTQVITVQMLSTIIN